MNNDLRARVLAYNRALNERKEKASDLDVIVAALIQLPPGQLKKVLTDDVLEVLKKHGYGYTE